MKTPAPKIMSTERVRQRFSEEQILHLVERSLFKMSESPDRSRNGCRTTEPCTGK